MKFSIKFRSTMPRWSCIGQTFLSAWDSTNKEKEHQCLINTHTLENWKVYLTIRNWKQTKDSQSSLLQAHTSPPLVIIHTIRLTEEIKRPSSYSRSRIQALCDLNSGFLMYHWMRSIKFDVSLKKYEIPLSPWYTPCLLTHQSHHPSMTKNVH